MTTYYVRKSGNDANGGTDPITDAVLTLARGIAVSANDDILDIGEGDWAEDMDSRRTYQGAGMFKTHISGITSYQSSLSYYQDIKLSIGAAGFVGVHTFSKVIVDYAPVAVGHRLFSSATITGDESIFNNISNPYVSDQACFYYPTAQSDMTNCVFSKVTDAANYFANGNIGNLYVKNCIIYEVQSISVSSAAFGLEEYNCWYSSAGAITNKPSGAFNATSLDNVDPLFHDPDGGDFRQTESSPTVGKGHA